MFYSPTCACCKEYIPYLRRNGFKVEVIEKLLAEKPVIDGIALPDMPAGSPGMGGFKIGKWTIYSLSDEQFSEFLTY